MEQEDNEEGQVRPYYRADFEQNLISANHDRMMAVYRISGRYQMNGAAFNFGYIKMDTTHIQTFPKKWSRSFWHPEKLHIELIHFKQKYTWDCGISCVLMVLRKAQRQDFLRNFGRICREEGFGGSTWTIDLCYLLRRYGVDHVFYTVTLGVHPGYRGVSFYHNILTKDETRVNQRFDDAAHNGVLVKRASVSFSVILEHLAANGPVIVLTNARLLNCDVCKFNKVRTELRKCLPWPLPYQGHYVVLCGYELNTQKIYYRNPSFADRVCVMSLAVLEEARKSYGTDEDVILVYNNNSSRSPSSFKTRNLFHL